MIEHSNIPSVINEGQRYNLIFDLLVKHANGPSASQPAIYFKDSVISYSDVYRNVATARSLITHCEVGRGDRVAIILQDSPTYIYLFLASISLGAIPVGINPNENAKDIPYFLKHVGASVAFVNKSESGDEHTRKVLETSTFLCRVDVDFEDFSVSFDRPTDLPWAYEVTEASDVLYLTFSSGTTGKPKAVIRRHRDILSCAQSVNESLMKLTPQDRIMTSTKLTFGYSLVGGFMFSFLAGSALIVIEEKLSAARIIGFAEKYKPTLLLAQPRLMGEFNHEIASGNTGWLQSLRTIMSAGDVLSPSLRQRWCTLTDIPVIEGFGSVEAGHFFIADKGEGTSKEPQSKLLPNYQIKLVDKNDQPAKEGEQGRLCLRGPSLATGYWNDPGRTNAVYKDGWYYSDDVFSIKDEVLTYAGRWDDMIKTGCGEWISPIRIENVIREADGVKDCAVKEWKDENGVTRVKAYIVPTAISAGEELTNKIQERVKLEWPLLEHMRAHKVEYVDEIPRSANGKIIRKSIGVVAENA